MKPFLFFYGINISVRSSKQYYSVEIFINIIYNNSSTLAKHCN